MARRLPPLQTLRAFDEAARRSSFTAAARALNVSQSAVSQQVGLLEASLGARLFHRRPQTLVLTEAGKGFAAAVAAALELIGQAADDVRGPERAQALSIAVIPSLSTRWLVPRLPRFHERHPEIEVSLYPAFEPADMEQAGAGIAILYGDGRWRGRRSELLWQERIFPVCAPALLGGDILHEPDDLFRLPLLRDADARHEYWPSWLSAAGARRRVVERGPKFDNLTDMIAAALDGQGVALVRSLLVADDLRAGRLVRAFSCEIPARYSYYLVWPRDAQDDAATAALGHWVRHELTAEEDGA